jgi:hypothetical protein
MDVQEYQSGFDSIIDTLRPPILGISKVANTQDVRTRLDPVKLHPKLLHYGLRTGNLRISYTLRTKQLDDLCWRVYESLTIILAAK